MMVACPSCDARWRGGEDGVASGVEQLNNHMKTLHNALYLDRLEELERRGLPRSFPVGVPITRVK